MRVHIEEIKESRNNGPVIKVFGVGGGGGNAVNRMISSKISAVDFIVANTDLQDLKTSIVPSKIQLGPRCTRGLGAGAQPGVGREAAMETADTLKEHISGADMVFITAGLGGGTGTGAAPVVAEIAKELGCLTVGVVTKPFKFEGSTRKHNAEEGILEITKHVDTLIVIPNDNLLQLADKQTSMIEAFAMVDSVLRTAIQGISDLITKEALINLDFADVRTVMSGMGKAIMGTGMGSGANRAIEAAEKAIKSPLLDDCRIEGAKGILINITGSTNMGILEANEAVSHITEQSDSGATIIFGANISSEIPEDQIEVTVIATGFNDGYEIDAPTPNYTQLTEPSPAPVAKPMMQEDTLQPAKQTVVSAPPWAEPHLPADKEPAQSEMTSFSNSPTSASTDPTSDSVPYTARENLSDSMSNGIAKSQNGLNHAVDLDIPSFIRRRSKRF